MKIEPTFETERYEVEGQEEIKWNNTRHHSNSIKKSIEILSEKNQILTKLDQYEEKFFKIENSLNVLAIKLDSLENISH